MGWREFVRGIYWHFMPGYIEKNALGCEDRDVPSFYWDGRTEMRCVQESMQSVLDHGYGATRGEPMDWSSRSSSFRVRSLLGGPGIRGRGRLAYEAEQGDA